MAVWIYLLSTANKMVFLKNCLMPIFSIVTCLLYYSLRSGRLRVPFLYSVNNMSDLGLKLIHRLAIVRSCAHLGHKYFILLKKKLIGTYIFSHSKLFI